MNYFKQQLQLIQTVNNNYKHIVELEAIEILLQYTSPNVFLSKEEIAKSLLICKTTHNSHYKYKLFTSSTIQNPNNHVDIQLELLKEINKEITAI